MSFTLTYMFPIGGVQHLRTTSSGTVTSVGLSLPSLFSVTGSPITGAGTLTGTLATQSANVVLAGPSSGGAATPTFRAVVAADLGTGTANSSTFLRGDMTWATPAGGGTVTSVGLSLPALFSVTGSPVTGSGTLSATLATQSANVIFAGPTSGGAAAPTFRTIVAADLGTGTADNTTFLRGDMTWATPGGGGTVTSVGLSLPAIFSVSGSPITGTGTLTASLATQAANVIFAGPTSGGAATPTFRSIVAADLGTGTANSSTYLRGDMTWATVAITPGGSTTHIQYNNAGSFAGSSMFTFDGTTIGINGSPVGTTRINIATSTMTAITAASSAPAGYTIVASNSSTVSGSGTLSLSNSGSSGATRTLNITNASSNTNAYGIYVNMSNATPSGIGIYSDGNVSQANIDAYNQSGSGYAGRFGRGGGGIQRVMLLHSAFAQANGAIGDGAALAFGARSSTTGYTEQATIHSVWTTATHASRTADMVFSLVVNATSTELMRLISDGTLRVGTGSIYFGLKPAGSGTPIWTMPSADGTANQVLKTDGAGNLGWATVGGSGTVTSVALTAPIEFVVVGSPVTTAGTLALSWDTQTANKVFASPPSGAPATPNFRSLVSDDIPSLDAAKITSGTMATARLGSGTANSTTFLRGDQTWAAPSVTTVSDATFRIQDNVDPTKQIAFEASSISPATTATITMPDYDVDLGAIISGTTRLAGASTDNAFLMNGPGPNYTIAQQDTLTYEPVWGRIRMRNGASMTAGDHFLDVQYDVIDIGLAYFSLEYAGSTATNAVINAIVTKSTETAGIHTVLRSTVNSNGTAAAGFGAAHDWRLESSTTTSQDAARMAVTWSTATHATRTSRFSLSLVDSASVLTEVLRVDGRGNLTSWISTSAASTLVEAQRISMATSGTPAAGLGVSQVFALESSTTANTDAAFFFARWTDPTHATFQAMFGICVYEGTGLSGSSTAPNFAVSGGGTWTQNQKTATTNAVVTAWTRTIDSTGTPAAGFGLRDLVQLDTNATPGVSAAAFDTTWVDAAAVTSTSQYQVYLQDSGTLTERYRFLNGGLDLRMTTARLYMNGTQVLTNRITGWAAPTGTATRSSFDTASVSLSQLAEHVKALIDDVMTHGIIGI